ncbi:MAG: hypothetical protein R3252_01800, partial [Robiginitalea sp.]|nr:hypothetical protein [Robiginitalea sp.]
KRIPPFVFSFLIWPSSGSCLMGQDARAEESETWIGEIRLPRTLLIWGEEDTQVSPGLVREIVKWMDPQR